MTDTPVIWAQGLTKRYGDNIALAGIDLAVPEGTILGLLGHNGAGKTTVMRILTTLTVPDGGRAMVGGHDVVAEAMAVRRDIGVTAQDATLDPMLTGRQNLVMIGRLAGLSRRQAMATAAELLERFDLDPVSRQQVWNVVRDLVADGTTVLLTTQYLDEADELADNIAVIDHGRVIKAPPAPSSRESAARVSKSA